MTPYQKIYDKFLLKIEDLELAKMNESDREYMLWNWLDSAIGLIQSEQISMQSDLTNRKDELRIFTDTLEANEVEAIALYMIGIWYEDRINSLEHTSMFWGTKDEKWNNPKDHMDRLYNQQSAYFSRARRMFRNYSYKAGLLSKGDD